MKKTVKLLSLCSAVLLLLCGCGNKSASTNVESANSAATITATTAASSASTKSKVTLDKMNPDAANEILSTLDSIRVEVKDTSAADSAEVIRQATSVMALAMGNSLSSEQTADVAAYWQQNHTADEFSELLKDYTLVYTEYKALCGANAEAELAKADLKLADYDFCGNGTLDMVEWINSALKSIAG